MPDPGKHPNLLRDDAPEVAFTRLFVANQSAFHGFLFSLIHDRHAADDLVQDLAARLWERFTDYDSSRPFVAWGLGFARLMAMEWRRRQSRLPLPLEDSALLALADLAQERACHHDVRRDALRECLGLLTPLQRETLHSRYEQETSVADMAHLAKRSEMAIYKVLKRAHQVLLDCIRGSLDPSAAQTHPKG